MNIIEKRMNTWKAIVVVSVVLVSVGVTSCSQEDKIARHLKRGNGYFDKRDYARAILEYKNAIQAKPSDAEPHYRLALTLLETGDVRSSMAMLRKALSLNSRHIGAQMKLVELMAFSRNPDWVREAEQRMRDILSFARDEEEGLKLLAITEWRLGKADDAEKHLKESMLRFPDSLQSAVTLAWLHVSRNRTAEAEELLKQMVARAKHAIMPMIALGRFYALTGRWIDAAHQFRTVSERDPDNGEILVDLARAQMEIKDLTAAEKTFERLARLPNKRYQVLQPIFYYQTGRPDIAVKLLQKMVQSDPGNRAARSLLVSAYLQRNFIADAEDLLKEALTKNSKDVEARLQRARIRLLQRRWMEGQADLLHVLNYEPHSPEAHYLLAKLHRVRGETMLERQELIAALKTDRTLLPARIELSKHLITARDPKGALQLMNETPKHQANMLETVIQRNWALLALKNFAETRKSVDSALSRVRSPDLLLQDAVLKIEADDMHGARRSLEEVISMRPDDVRAIQALAGSYAMKRHGAKALAVVRECAASQPKSAQVQALAGRWLFEFGDYEGARQAYLAVRALLPDVYDAEVMLAEIDQAEGKMDVARQRLEKVVSSPGVTSSIFFKLGNIEEALKNHDAALRHYRKTVELNPRHVWALNNLAFLLVDYKQNPDEALKYAQQAMEALPDNHVVEDTLGWVYYHKGIYLTAIKHLEKAIKNGGGPASTYRLASAYAKAGRRVQAEQTLEAALRIAPDLPEASIAREALRSAADVVTHY